MIRTSYPKNIDPYADVHHPEPDCPIRKKLIEEGNPLWAEVPEPQRSDEERACKIDATSQTIRLFDDVSGAPCADAMP